MAKNISNELLRQTIKSIGGITAVEDIKAMRADKATLTAIGKKYKISTMLVKAIIAL